MIDSQAYRKMDVCDKGSHQPCLGTERNIPVIPNWFQPCQCRCYLCYPGEYLWLGSLIGYTTACALKLSLSHLFSHLSLNREGHWGTTDDFATNFLHLSLFSTALWDLANSSPVHSPMLSFYLFLCLPCLLPPYIVPCKMVLARPDERETC